MGIDLSAREPPVAEQFLNDTGISSSHQASREGMTKHVRVDRAVQGDHGGGTNNTLDLAGSQRLERIALVKGEKLRQRRSSTPPDIEHMLNCGNSNRSKRNNTLEATLGDLGADQNGRTDRTSERQVKLTQSNKFTDSQTGIEHEDRHTVIANRSFFLTIGGAVNKQRGKDQVTFID
ncbi:hypothetical protein ES705_25228 [subsurface metagenome]